MIELDNVCKIYNNDKLALHDISFKLPNTGLVCVVGKSGCGKTTLLNILSGATKPSSGAYFIEGKNTEDFSNHEWAEIRTNYFGYIFQNYNLLDSCTVYENLKIATLNLGYEVEESKIDDILKKLDILEIKNKKINELSGGERQRVSIARVLIKDVNVVLADEPTGALDFENGNNVFEILKEISKDRLVVVVTHDNEFALKYADYFIKLHYGKITENTIDKISEPNKFDSKLNLNFKKIKELKNIILKNNIKKNFFSIFIYAFFTMLLCLTLHISSFSSTKFTYDSIISNNIKYNYVSDQQSDFQLNHFSPNIMNLDVSDLDVNYVYLDTIDFSYKKVFGIDLSGSYLFKKIIIDEEYKDYEIGITDWFLDEFKLAGIINFNDYSEVIGKTIYFYNVGLKIKDIDKANFNKYKHSRLYFDSNCTLVKMNENTFKMLLCYMNYQYDKNNNYKYQIDDALKFSSHCGSSSLAEGEIGVTDSIVWNYFQCYDEFKQDRDAASNKYIGKKIIIKEKEYIIKAITYDEGFVVTYSKDEFKKYFKYENIVLDKYKYSNTYIINFSSYRDYYLANETLKENHLYLVNGLTLEINDVINTVNGIFKYSAMILTILLAIVLLIFILYTTRVYVKNNKKTIGILGILGFENKQVHMCYYYSNRIITVIELLAGIILGIAAIYLFNIYGYTETGIEILHPKFTIVIFVSLIVVFISFFTLFFMLKKLSKYDAIKLLYIE